MESFFHTLKTELVMHCDYKTPTVHGPVCSITWKCSTTGSVGTHRLATRPRYRSRR
jgi:hypothetical protein